MTVMIMIAMITVIITRLKLDMGMLKLNMAMLEFDMTMSELDMAMLEFDIAMLKLNIGTLKLDMAMSTLNIARMKLGQSWAAPIRISRRWASFETGKDIDGNPRGTSNSLNILTHAFRIKY